MPKSFPRHSLGLQQKREKNPRCFEMASSKIWPIWQVLMELQFQKFRRLSNLRQADPFSLIITFIYRDIDKIAAIILCTEKAGLELGETQKLLHLQPLKFSESLWANKLPFLTRGHLKHCCREKLRKRILCTLSSWRKSRMMLITSIN